MGSATTDDNGVASYTYTGHGSGEMDFIASTSNPFDESSLVSETYELYDCLAYNKETSANDFYTYWNDTLHSANTITVNDTGTLIETNASAYSSTYMQIWLHAIPTYTDVPVCSEIEVVEGTNYILCHHMVQNDDSVIWSSTNMTQGKWKINITNNKLEVYKDGVLQKQQDTNTKQVRLYLQSTRASGNGRIKFKNHRVYPI